MEARLLLINKNEIGHKALINFRNDVAKHTLEPGFAEMIKVYISTLNGCAACIKAHSLVAMKLKVPLDKLLGVTAWPESNLYSDQEKAALQFAKYMTLISENGVPEKIYQQTAEHFSEKEIGDLMLIICLINTHNRIALASGFRAK